VPPVAATAKILGAIDEPGPRRIHKSPIPRGGGVAVFIGFYVAATSVFYFLPDVRETLIDREWWGVFSSGALLIVLVGVIDDLTDLRARYKLIGQIAASLVLFAGGIRFTGVLGLHFPLWLDGIATIAWFVLIINALNLVDGYDGLAAGLASIAALGIGGSFIYRHLPAEALIVCALIGSCVGFLRYNRYPASIFLGDSGSMFLGFTLAAVTISTASRGTGLAAIWLPILALGVPVFDTSLAVWRRLTRKILAYLREEEPGSGIMSADMDHVHHRLVRTGLAPRNVTATLYLANSAMVLIGMLALVFHDRAIGILSAGFGVGIFLLFRVVARVELWDSGLVIVHSLTKVNRPWIAIGSFLTLDSLSWLVAIMGTRWFLHLPFQEFRGVPTEEVSLAYMGISSFLILTLHPYVTLLARKSIFVQLPEVFGLCGSGLIMYALMLVHQPSSSLLHIRAILVTGIWLVLVSLVRLFPVILARVMQGRLLAAGEKE
jgi:UDP-N-acetylmuramyl pentapeptide phosphotransferase/UDP-N-acetylglucosamine-1-phosphate transferase